MSPHEQATWSIQATAASWTLYNAPIEFIILHSTPQTPKAQWQVRELEVTRLEDDSFSGSIRVLETGDDPWVQWTPAKSMDLLAIDARLMIGAPAAYTAQGVDPDRIPLPRNAAFRNWSGHGGLVASEGPLALQGPGQQVFYEARLAVVKGDAVREVATGAVINASQSMDFIRGERMVYDRIFAVLEGELRVELQGPGALWAVARLQGGGKADLMFRDVVGEYAINGIREALARDVFQVVGTFEVESRLDGEQPRWHLVGKGQFVGINGQTVAGERSPLHIVPTVAILAGLGGLGVCLALLLGRSKAIDHATQLAFLRWIRDEPAITRMELAHNACISRSSARHHLRMLARQRLVTELAGTRNPAYVLLVTADVMLEGFADGEATLSQALAVLGHAGRREILAAAHDGVAYESFSGTRSISKSTFSEHCTILEAAGWLDRTRQGVRVTWHARHSMAAIRSSILQAFLHKNEGKLPDGVRGALQDG